jgi:hypothetical protein
VTLNHVLQLISTSLCHVLSSSCTSDVADVCDEGTPTLNDEHTAQLPDVLSGCIIQDHVEVETLISEKPVEDLKIESILGVRKPALTALQRRKKKVKESRSTMSSHLIDDDIDD